MERRTVPCSEFLIFFYYRDGFSDVEEIAQKGIHRDDPFSGRDFCNLDRVVDVRYHRQALGREQLDLTFQGTAAGDRCLVGDPAVSRAGKRRRFRPVQLKFSEYESVAIGRPDWARVALARPRRPLSLR